MSFGKSLAIGFAEKANVNMCAGLGTCGWYCKAAYCVCKASCEIDADGGDARTS